MSSLPVGIRAVIRRASVPAVAALLAAGLAACSQTSGLDSGTVSGVAAPCVGITKASQAKVTVYARHNGRIVKSERVVLTKSYGSPYRLTLPPAAYVISAPQSYLPARTVSVQAGGTIIVNFLPSCK